MCGPSNPLRVPSLMLSLINMVQSIERGGGESRLEDPLCSVFIPSIRDVPVSIE